MKVNVKKFVRFLDCFILISSLVAIISLSEVHAEAAETSTIIVTHERQGINVTLSDRFELFFNASNGGEITRYYDLVTDPLRLSNLIPPRPYLGPYNLWPMFTSGLYDPPIPNGTRGTTGGDGNGAVTVLGQNTNYTILQSTSRIKFLGSKFFKDIGGNFVYLNSTWLIRSDGYIFLERTFYATDPALIPQGYRWYPLIFSRTKGFEDIGTFYLFNTTYAYPYTVSEETYEDNYNVFPKYPTDKNGFFGAAAPFSNKSLGGDETNNIVLIHKFDESLNISEWRSDTYNGWWGSAFGPTHEFQANHSMVTNTYYAMIVITHKSINEENLINYANYFSKNPVFPLLEATLATNKPELVYAPGDLFSLYLSGAAHYDLMNLTVTLMLEDTEGVVWMKSSGTRNASEGQMWSDFLLLNKTIPLSAYPDSYTFTLRYLSSIRIVVASDSITFTVIPLE